ncbi:carbohydrate kinase family protein [Psychromarinibacter sp. C21-152]|uniref:Carbohydrate kinase family protein n=1 Tax=Psychromarinibacter sediminicola TaxID=3033385 RepID=A0AAE3NXG9_9RHOB|nr:carbohydrate kinase family protein [Psychromarinibacter sediminicola]MDF0602745.1 carbohydrate kinase family protein [Psychromarinibacter sediminicola]
MQPLAVVGNVNVDMILGPAAPWPVPGSEVIVPHDELRVGGSAANSAQAWLALGADFQFVANTGSDLFGRWMRDQLAPHAEAWPVAAGASTVSVGITHPNGERTFFTTAGHLAALTWEQVRDGLDWERLASGWLLLCGAFLTTSLTAEYDALFAKARAHGVRVALDTGWPPTGWNGDVRREAFGWAAQVDALLVNEVEAAALTERDDPAPDDLARLLRPGGIAVIKRGAQGAEALGPGGRARCAAPAVEVVDSVGAGDVFNAAFLHALARDTELEEAVALGVRTASLAVSTHPRRYLPSP